MTISTKKQRELLERLARLGLDASTVVEKFIRGGGPGGQNVNRRATCVYLKHRESGIEVKVQRERSQSLNRFLAWRLLADKLEEQVHRRRSEERKRREKIRRQKRRRSRRAKQKMLADKRMRSRKKAWRKGVRADGQD